MSTAVILEALAHGLRKDERLVIDGEPWKPGTKAPPDAQRVSLTASTGAGLALLVEDLGVGKANSRKVRNCEATHTVETSHGNFVCFYLLHAPERNVARFEAAVRAFVGGGLMQPERVAPLGGRLVHTAPTLRFSTEGLMQAFNLKRVPPPLRVITNVVEADLGQALTGEGK